MCAMITTNSFKSAYSLYPRQFHLHMLNLLHSFSFPSKTLPLLLCLFAFVTSLPKPVVWSRWHWGSLSGFETLVEGKKARNREADPSVSNEMSYLKKEACRKTCLFLLSVLCKELLRREEKFFCFPPIVFPDCFPNLQVTLERSSVIVVFSSNDMHHQPYHTCWKFYFQMYNLW